MPVREKKMLSWILPIGLFVLWTGLGIAFPAAQDAEKVSGFGEYKGYSADIYDSWVRTSLYLTMRDGVRLAADIIRPAVGGKVEEKPLPAIFTHTRYQRATVENGKISSEADSRMSQMFLKRGYVVAVVDVRGSGASFGVWKGIFTPEESRDAYEVIEWLAGQPWCDGNIGMAGGSYLGATQLMAASTKPPHLKALFPAVPPFDIFEVGSHNGVFFDDLIKTWSDLTKLLDTEVPAAPVDEDRDGSLLKQALKDHQANRPLIEIMLPLRFRDSRDEGTGAYPFRAWHPAGYIKEVSESKIPAYLWGGWFDSFTKDVFLMFRNYDVPRRLVVGAWSHSPRDPEIQKEEYGLVAVEELRWFDRWLKGIRNGIEDEPAFRYQVMKTPQVKEWRTSETWPVPGAQDAEFYLQAGPSGSIGSSNDGMLARRKPSGNDGKDAYTVDFSTTTGQTTRWDNAVGGGFGYPDMAANDGKGLTYTTEPLDADVTVTGHPVAHIWVSSTADDGDLLAYLEEVEPSGFSRYVTEGAIRISYRSLQTSPLDYIGLPYHRSYKEDVAPLKPGEAAELVFDFQPTSNVFDAGNRIRLTLTGADKDNAETIVANPSPTIAVYRGKERSSRLVLPVMGGLPAADEGGKATVLLFGVAFLIIILVIAFTLYMRRKS